MVTFCSDGRSGAVTRQNAGFVGQGEQAGFDGVDNLPGVAARKVGAADASGEQGVSGDEQFERSKVETDRSLGVAGGVQHFSRVAPKADNQAIGEASVGRRRLRRGDAHPAGLHLHHFEQGQIVLIEQDGSAGEPFQLEGAPNVVDVSVGNEDLLEFEAQFGEASVDAADFVAGIDDNGLSGLFVAQQGAVALQRADGKGLKNHMSILKRKCLSSCQ